MKNMVITGASRGLGAAFNQGIADAGDSLWLVSRGEPFTSAADGIHRHWIAADLSDLNAAQHIRQALGETRLDALVYNAGIWEASAFSSRYDLTRVSIEETVRVLTVNLTSAITTISALLPNLRQSANAKIILIGSINGLENNPSPEVAYGASKFGLRGVAHSLREHLRQDSISVTCINPGTISTEVPYEAGVEAALRQVPGAIPVHDLVQVVRCVLSLSAGSSIKEIDIPGMADAI